MTAVAAVRARRDAIGAPVVGSRVVGSIAAASVGDVPRSSVGAPVVGSITAASVGDVPHSSVEGRRDAGFVSAEWAIGIAVLVVPVLMLVAVLPSWAAQRDAAAAAAREAARVAAMSPAANADAAVSAATSLLAGRGVDLAGARITVDVPPPGSREGAVRSHVHIPGRTAHLPLFGSVAGPPATASHVVHLDPHRSLP